MSSSVGIIDTTLRDGHQCYWATRMTTAMALGVAEKLDRAGYHQLDIMSGAHFDAYIRYLRENPWERIRLLRQRIVRTPIHVGMRSKSFIAFDTMPDDLIELTYTLLYANGIRRIGVFDALHDIDNFRFGMEICKKLGFYICGTIVFSISPVHTDDYYVEKTRAIFDLGANLIRVKDPSGLLTVDRTRTLVPALRKVAGERPVEIHSHCLTGMGPLVALESATLGADAVYTCVPPLADGPSHPSVFNVVENLKLMGYDIPLDLEPIREASRLLTAIARNEGWPLGHVAQYDLFHYQHQMPGGMIANLRSQLRDVGMENRLQEVLEEIPRVREELGWPIMVTPFSQLVGVQALMNVVQGERYHTIPDEIAKWAYGYYGKLEAPLDPEVMDRIAVLSAGRVRPDPQPPEPVLPSLRKAYPHADDEEIMLRAFFKGAHVDNMLAARPMNLVYEYDRDMLGLVKRLVETADSGRVVFNTADLEMAWQR